MSKDKEEKGGLIKFDKIGSFLQDFGANQEVRKAVQRGVADKAVRLAHRREEMELGLVYVKAVADTVQRSTEGPPEQALSREQLQQLFVSSSMVSQAVQCLGLSLIFDALTLREKTKLKKNGKPAIRRTSIVELQDALIACVEEMNQKTGASMSILYDIGKFIDEHIDHGPDGKAGQIFAHFDKNGVMETPDKYTQPPDEPDKKTKDADYDDDDAVAEDEMTVKPVTPEDIRRTLK